MRNDREILYQALQMADEQRKRRNFDAFMTGLEIGLIDDLNKAYASGDMEKYDRLKKRPELKYLEIVRVNIRSRLYKE